MRGRVLVFLVFAFVAAAVVFAADPAEAAVCTANVAVTIQGIPITLSVAQNLSVKVGKSGSQAVYDSTALKSVVPGQILSTQEAKSTSITTIPATVTLSHGSSTAVISLTCRHSASGYVSSVSGGSSCTSPVSTTTGYDYLSIYPTGVDFSASDNSKGNYTGTATLDTEYY